jgi:hypothetical protein
MPKKRIGPLKKFSTLATLLTDFAAGVVTLDEMQNIIRAIEQGVGMRKHDVEIAKTIQNAPPDYTSDPVYIDGFNTGLWAGYAAAQEDLANGLDITKGEPPQVTEPAPESLDSLVTAAQDALNATDRVAWTETPEAEEMRASLAAMPDDKLN